MTCRTINDTNAGVETACSSVRELIQWADADAEHAAENDAPDTARDDRARAKMLRKALQLLEQCKR